MYFVAEKPRPHYVSIKTGKQYWFKHDVTGADQLRALNELERDDTPAPEPEPKPQVAQSKPQPMDVGSQVRAQLDEMKLEQLRKHHAK